MEVTISNNVSCLNHGGGGETDFRDKLAAVSGNSSKMHVACRDKSSLLKTGPVVLCTVSLMFCEPVCCKYTSTNGRMCQAISGTMIPS